MYGGFADHHVVGVRPEDVDGPYVLLDILGPVGVSRRLRRKFALLAWAATAVKEGVADGDVEGEVGGVGEALDVAGLHGGDEQAEPGDGDRERVFVDAVQAGLGRSESAPRDPLWCLLLPLREQAREGAEQEVAGAAGRVDHP